MSEVGEKLKAARIEKGYTLDDLQQITKIQKRYLVAIEEGNLDVLPGNFYVRAFIKQYADTVGLNGENLLSEYTDYIPGPKDQQYTEKLASTQTRSQSRGSSFGDSVKDNLPTILVVFLVMTIVLAVYFAIRANSDSENSFFVEDESTTIVVDTSENKNKSESDEESSMQEDIDTTEENETEKDASSEEETEKPSLQLESSNGSSTIYTLNSVKDDVNFSLTAENGDSWVSIEVDGSVIEQGLITDGQSLQTTLSSNNKSVNVVIGNASATVITVGEQVVEYAPEAEGIVRQDIEFQINP